MITYGPTRQLAQLRQAVCNAACVCGFAIQERRDLAQTVAKTTVGSSGSSKTPLLGRLRMMNITVYINVIYVYCNAELGSTGEICISLIGKTRHVIERQQDDVC